LGLSGARCNFGAAQATQTEFPTSGRGGINANFTPLLNDYSYDQLAHLVDLAIKDNKQESYNSGVKVISGVRPKDRKKRINRFMMMLIRLSITTFLTSGSLFPLIVH